MIDLVKVVKENLPSNVSLTREPYKVTLADNLPYFHGYMGYVFHTKTVLVMEESIRKCCLYQIFHMPISIMLYQSLIHL